MFLRSLCALVAGFCLAGAPSAFAQVSLTTVGTPVLQDFNTLAATGTSSTVPTGWAFAETGTNANTTYTAGTGSANGGDTYSFGTAADRAFGGLQSGSLISTVGAQLQNNTGGVLTGLQIAYRGEQWRLGAASRVDRLDFEYSTDATSLTTGVWTPVDTLDFIAPVTALPTGALDGNLAANATAVSAGITGLTVAAGGTIWIRWTDFNATGADDGLAIDDVSITPQGVGGSLSVSINDVTVDEGNVGTTNAGFLLTLSAPAVGGETVRVDTAAGTATAGTDYTTLGTSITFVAGELSRLVNVSIIGDTTPETNENYVVLLTSPSGLAIGDGSGLGIITNDDFSLTPINQIQGSGLVSPIADGTTVTTEGIVTGIKNNGFFIQSSDAEADANPATSEGILVFTGTGAVPASVVVGARVRVSGNVKEFIPTTDLFQPPTTELEPPFTVTQLSTGNPLPTPVVVNSLNPAGDNNQLENREHMRVSIASLVVVAPTRGFVSEPNATGSTNGQLWATLPGATRPRREPGIDIRETLIAGMPAGVPRFDGNPETLRVDTDGLVGAVALELAAGQTIGALTGIMDYGFRFYTFLPDPAQSPAISAVPVANSAAPAGASEFTVATYNLQRFFDTVNDPATSDAVLTPAAFANRLSKASLQIRQNLGAPDILAVVEMENLTTLQALATQIQTDGGPAYVASLVDGNDPGGIDVGFLTKSTRVTINSVVQEGATATYLNPTTNTQELLNDRPPLVLQATINSGTGTATVTVIANHLRSFLGTVDPVDGPRVRAKRLAQAEFLANLVQARQAANANERIVVVGDFNAYEFNDGYVDSIGSIIGNPTPATQVLLPGNDLVNPNLVRMVDASADYSYSFDGFTQNIDHVLVSAGLVTNSTARSLTHVRLNADYPETARSNYTAGANTRISDHDALVLRVTVPSLGIQPTSCVLSSTTATPVVGMPVNYRVQLTPTAAVGSVTVTAAAGETCTAAVAAGESNCTITYASAGARTINAGYTAGAGFSNSNCGPLAQTIATAGSTVVVLSATNPSFIGQSVNFTATVTGVNPTGTVEFLNGTSVLGSAALGGTGNTRSASLAVSNLPVGTASISARYLGDANNAPMTGAAINQVVQAGVTTTTLSISPVQPNLGQAVTLTATVTVAAPAVGPAVGSVSFLSGGLTLGSANLVNGVAVLNLPGGLPVGASQITARYQGTASYGTSTSAAVLSGSLVAVPSLNHFGLLLLLGVMLGLGLVGVRRQSL